MRRPVLMSHAKPDGDAMGSLLAMHSLLSAKGIAATALCFEPVPDRYQFMAGAKGTAVGDAAQAAGVLSQADGVIIMDTCTYSQLEPVADWLRTTRLPRFVIDHHLTRDPITDRMLVDTSASATCAMIYELARFAEWPMDPPTAACLFVGIATDTGWFRHSNTDDRALAAAAELTALGVRPHELYEALYLKESAGRVRLLGEALGTLELLAGNQLAIMTLSRDAFRRADATAADTEDIVNEPLRIASVVVSILLVEQDDGVTRVNFRSKAPGSNSHRPDVDVSAIARQFGGGGHHRAAGARSRLSVRDAREMAEAVVAKCFQCEPGPANQTNQQP